MPQAQLSQWAQDSALWAAHTSRRSSSAIEDEEPVRGGMDVGGEGGDGSRERVVVHGGEIIGGVSAKGWHGTRKSTDEIETKLYHFLSCNLNEEAAKMYRFPPFFQLDRVTTIQEFLALWIATEMDSREVVWTDSGRRIDRRWPVFGGKTMARHRTCSIEFKRQVAQEFLGGERLAGLARRHDICRSLIRVWVAKYESGAFRRRSPRTVRARGSRPACRRRRGGRRLAPSGAFLPKRSGRS